MVKMKQSKFVCEKTVFLSISLICGILKYQIILYWNKMTIYYYFFFIDYKQTQMKQILWFCRK